jgi:3-oxoacyl-[acyl-carrier protein] reductase
MIIPRSEGPPAALITGAASGVGAALSSRLQADGWVVAGVDVTASSSDVSVEADISDPEAMANAMRQVCSCLGRLDGVANCAGIFPPDPAPAHVVSAEAWERVIAINLTGAFFVAKESLPHLCASKGSLVFVASMAAAMPTPGSSAYTASKAGVLGLMRSLAIEYGRFGVRVNAVSPGWIDTPMAAPVLGKEEWRASIESRIPAGAVASDADIASITAFLLSAASQAMTGSELVADGGQHLTANIGDRDLDRVWRKFSHAAGGTA